ncbi:DUF6138 family protein [Paenibacillus puerhi]|uniref:DUF6138 family protein n=1 Tax=Paenibacillus puerhi TaxID=2692622 RepID=UPI0013584C8B|nr:DUF6138 family protein [Paenibacillus puerhi]
MEYELDWETISEDITKAIGQWFDQIGAKDADRIVGRTPLQAGIYDFVRFEYKQGSILVYSTDDDFTSPEVTYRGVPQPNRLTEERLYQELLPRLQVMLLHRIERLQQSPLLDFECTVAGTFWTQEGPIRMTVLHAVDQAKKKRLLRQVNDYVQLSLELGEGPTDELDTFFLARHLVNLELYPQLDAAKIKRIFEMVMELNKCNKEKLAHHRRYITQALKHWVENRFLPRHFEILTKEWYRKEYRPRHDSDQLSPEKDSIELLLYTAIMILKYEPNYSRSTAHGYLDRAKELGSPQAARILKEGSGSWKSEEVSYKDEDVVCQAHDVFSIIQIKIIRESAESYSKALDFITRLLNNGFPKSYQIKCRAASKHFLPIRGLAKSQTHYFFANAMQYPSLYPKLEAYARAAMAAYEWYDDHAGDKSCMPGSYAVFGLGLVSPRYFPLIRDYMELVDQEHQSVQNSFTLAWVRAYGIEAKTIPTLAACLISCTDSLKLKVNTTLETEDNLALLVKHVRKRDSFEVGHLIDLLWGGRGKLEAKANKETSKRSSLLALLKLSRHPVHL